jgi:hypothetical protein
VGIQSIADLNRIIPGDFKNRYKRVRTPRDGINLFRLLTHVLVIYKFDEYFKKVWRTGEMFDTHDYLIFKKFGLDTDEFPQGVEFDCYGM